MPQMHGRRIMRESEKISVNIVVQVIITMVHDTIEKKSKAMVLTHCSRVMRGSPEARENMVERTIHVDYSLQVIAAMVNGSIEKQGQAMVLMHCSTVMRGSPKARGDMVERTIHLDYSVQVIAAMVNGPIEKKSKAMVLMHCSTVMRGSPKARGDMVERTIHLGYMVVQVIIAMVHDTLEKQMVQMHSRGGMKQGSQACTAEVHQARINMIVQVPMAMVQGSVIT